MGAQDDFLNFVDGFHAKRGAYPEDYVLRWLMRRPRVAICIAFGVISGIPAVVGIIFGALVF